MANRTRSQEREAEARMKDIREIVEPSVQNCRTGHYLGKEGDNKGWFRIQDYVMQYGVNALNSNFNVVRGQYREWEVLMIRKIVQQCREGNVEDVSSLSRLIETEEEHGAVTKCGRFTISEYELWVAQDRKN